MHYVLPDGPRTGEHRAAMVTRVYDAERGLISLNVALDGPYDSIPVFGFGESCYLRYVSGVRFDEAKTLATWHWIEPA